MSRTKEYNTWMGMRQRCNNPKSHMFPRYGANGIKVCKRWDDFKNFLLDMGEAPTKLHSIDRIDSNGDYKPSNCRWATREQQNQNRRKPKSNTSGYMGVHWHKCGRWQATLKVNGKRKYLGLFKTAEEAARAYNEAKSR